jgi:ferredoxin-NADP reductase
MVHQVRLEGTDEVAEGTMALRFSRPDGFDFRAGQAIDLILPSLEGGDPQAARHAFSIVSAPHEPGLTVATRMRDSEFKRALRSLPVYAMAKVDGPFGSLTLPKNPERPVVLVAGGIGITPFMSMLRQSVHERSSRPIVLLYSNRRPEDAAFLGELRHMAERNPGFRLVATMTDLARSTVPWKGEARQIDAAMVRNAIAGLDRPIAYVAGPPGMVAALRGVLAQAGIDEDDIRSEEFFGY